MSPQAYLPLPDPFCQPGATYSVVTQSTINSTICVSGWTSTVRPPTSYTNPLKVTQIAQYGYSDTSTADYEEDHLIPLELGGSPTSALNLWPRLRLRLRRRRRHTTLTGDSQESRRYGTVGARTFTPREHEKWGRVG